jgi:hypothetical protein
MSVAKDFDDFSGGHSVRYLRSQRWITIGRIGIDWNAVASVRCAASSCTGQAEKNAYRDGFHVRSERPPNVSS